MELKAAGAGERLDKFLAERVKELSRSAWQRAIRNGSVKVNGHFVVKPGFFLRAGDRIVVLEEKLLSPHKPFVPEPEPEIPLEVAYEDADMLVVNKPSGLLTHPTLAKPRHTLVNALVARYPALLAVGESSLRPGIVHRLDRDTSGLLIVAKTGEAFSYLKEQFLLRRVEKRYLALVEGVPKDREGVIEYAIRPAQKNRLKKVAVKRKGERVVRSVRAALTRYRVRSVFGDRYALLEVTPETGRTHQIRVHLSSIGHPVVGDTLYGARRTPLKRQFLHAYYLKFTAPNGTPLALHAELPADLNRFLEDVKRSSP